MYYLSIDTTDWINLCKQDSKVLLKISKLVDKSKIVLCVHNLVLEEWKQHKDKKVIEANKQSLRGKIKNAKELVSFLPEDDAPQYKKILLDFGKDSEGINNLASVAAHIANSLLYHPTTIHLETNEQVKLLAVEYALLKRAPFGTKNSIIDALILFDFLALMEERNIKTGFFVSGNTHDFAAKKKPDLVHDDLKPLFEKSNVRYFSNIGKAINTVEKNLISEEEIRKIERNNLVHEYFSSIEVFLENKQAFEHIQNFLQSEIMGKDPSAMEELYAIINTTKMQNYKPFFNNLHNLKEQISYLEEWSSYIPSDLKSDALQQIVLTSMNGESEEE